MIRVTSQKHFIVPIIILCVVMMGIKPASADRRKFVMLIEKPPTAMIYKRGIFLNKWVPFQVDGFYMGKPMAFGDFARQFFIESSNPVYELTFFPNSSNSHGSCRISSRSTSKGKSLQFYRGNGDNREYLVMDDREDYLKFACREE